MEEYTYGLRLLEEAYKASMQEFIKWVETNWKLTDKDKKDLDFNDDYKSGYNAAIDGLQGAFQCFADEQH